MFISLISLLVGCVLAVCNLIVVLGIAALRYRHGVAGHLLGWVAYVAAGVAVVLGTLSGKPFNLPLFGIAVLLMALAVIIAFHLLYLIHLLRQSRTLPPSD